MKKLSILFVALFLLGSVQTFAQSGDNSVTVYLGQLMPRYVDGKALNAAATRDEIINNRSLMIPPPPCDITEFTVSIQPKGKDLIGPFTINGATLSPKVISLLQNMEDPQGKIFIENIKVKCMGKDMTGRSFIVDMIKK